MIIDRDSLIKDALEVAGTPHLEKKANTWYYQLLEYIYTRFPHAFGIKSSTQSISADEYTINLPEDFVFEKGVYLIDSDGNKKQLHHNPNVVDWYVAGGQTASVTGQPRYYTIYRQEESPYDVLYLYPKADKSYTLAVGYHTVDESYLPPITNALVHGLIAKCLEWDNDDRAGQYLQMFHGLLAEFEDSPVVNARMDFTIKLDERFNS